MDARLFKALGDPTRLKLFACLVKCGRPCTVSELAACCAVDFSVVARHLRTLAAAELVDQRREGRVVWSQAKSQDLLQRLATLSAAIAEWSGPSCCPEGACDAS